jgi:transcription elongation factor GreA
MSARRDQTVTIGNWVKILDLGDEEEEVLYLVDEAAANAAQSRISARSPFAQAILGSKPGQVVTFATPGGKAKVKILDTGKEKAC